MARVREAEPHQYTRERPNGTVVEVRGVPLDSLARRPMSLPTIENPVEFLIDNGILFEMNRQVLHPLGLELHFRLDDDGRITAIDLLDNRGGDQPISFAPEAFAAGRGRYEAYLAEHGRRNMQKRRKVGMVIQTGPIAPRAFEPGDGDEPSTYGKE